MQGLKEIDENYTIKIHENNRGCIGIAKSLETKDAKHIGIKHQFIRDNIASGVIRLKPISSELQLADTFTKAFNSNRFIKLRSQLGVTD